MARSRARERGDDGLGVIDLMVSVVGFLLLTAMGAASLIGLLGMTALAACQSDGQTIQTALESFVAANGPSVTPTQADLLPATPGGTTAPAGIIGGPYLSIWPSNPAHYTYSIATSSGTDSNGLAYTAGQEMIAVAPSTTANLYTGPSSCNGVH
jgi:hypothetical protein